MCTHIVIKDFLSLALKQFEISEGTGQKQRIISIFQSLTGSSLKN